MTTKKIYGPWIKWHGGECPVPPETLVQVRFRDGTIEPVHASSEYCWYHDDGDDDIVEYCTVTEQADLGAAEQLLRANGYTIIPPTKPITFEDVTPIMGALEEGTEYWVVSLSNPEGVVVRRHTGRNLYEHLVIKRGMAYLNKEHALIAARHIFGLKGGEL